MLKRPEHTTRNLIRKMEAKTVHTQERITMPIKKKYQEWSKRWRRKRHYGATSEEVEQYLADCEKQKMTCLICKKVGIRQGKVCLEYDHDHQTGRYRGAICGTCNKGLGLFQDDLIILEAAVQYLKESAK